MQVCDECSKVFRFLNSEHTISQVALFVCAMFSYRRQCDICSIAHDDTTAEPRRNETKEELPQQNKKFLFV